MDSVDSIFEEITQDVKIEAKEELDALVKDEEHSETPFQNTLFVIGCRAVGEPAIKWFNRYFSLFPGIKRHRVVIDRELIDEISSANNLSNNKFVLCVQFDAFLGSINEIERFLEILKAVMTAVYFNDILFNRLDKGNVKFNKMYNCLNGTRKLISSELSNRSVERQIRITDYNDSVITNTAIKVILNKNLNIMSTDKKFSGGYLFDNLYINNKLEQSLRKMMTVFELPFSAYANQDFNIYEYSNRDKETIDEMLFGTQTPHIKRGCILEGHKNYDACYHYYLCIELKEIIVDYELVKRFVVFELPNEINRLYYHLMTIFRGSLERIKRIIDGAENALGSDSFSFRRNEMINTFDKPYVFRG